MQKQKPIHQMVAESFLGHVPNGLKSVVNHKNFIKNDNRLDNLEIVTVRENSNRKHIPHSSKYTGVGWHKRDKIWQSRIIINGAKKHLGYFHDELEASKAYEQALKNIQNGEN
jgi:hypothetical protein